MGNKVYLTLVLAAVNYSDLKRKYRRILETTEYSTGVPRLNVFKRADAGKTLSSLYIPILHLLGWSRARSLETCPAELWK